MRSEHRAEAKAFLEAAQQVDSEAVLTDDESRISWALVEHYDRQAIAHALLALTADTF